MAVRRSAACPACGKTITLNRDGLFRPHGHPARRCPSSGDAPAYGSAVQAVVTQEPSHGECSHCLCRKRLKKDGTVFRHLDYRRGHEIQQGWCPGSDEKPKEN